MGKFNSLFLTPNSSFLPMLLTIDIGTSSFKAALWDLEGNRLDFASVPLSISINDNFRHEAEPGQWLCALEQCIRKLKRGAVWLRGVKAIVISGHGPSLVPVLSGPVVSWPTVWVRAENARLWLDRRAVKYQDEVSALMGGFVDAGFFLPKILGYRNEEGVMYRFIKYFLGCPEFLAYALTGKARTVFPCEGFDRWFWNDGVLKKLKLDRKKFPSFIRPGEAYGTILPDVADCFCLDKGIPVVAGGPDFFAAILGSGAIEPGQALDRTGSSEGVNLCTKGRVEDPRLMSYGHPVKPYWNLSGIISTTGKAVEWARDIIGIYSFSDFFSLAGNSAPGSGGVFFLPYLAGERAPVWNPAARALWSGIGLSSGRAELANSVLEGICFAMRDVISVMEEAEGGAGVGQLRVTGGLAASPYLNQMKADITGKEVLEPAQKEAELLGLAAIGACYLGKFASFAEASRAMVRIEKTYKPSLENADVYDGLFNEYKKAQALLKTT